MVIFPILALILLLLIPAGMALLLAGLIGRSTYSEPHCGRCRYDLTGHLMAGGAREACPECGTSLLEPGAVKFGRRQRRPVLALVGAGLLILPVLLLVVSIPIGVAGGGGRNLQSNATVLANVAANPDEPWDWDEVVRRIQTGSMSSAEVDRAIDTLIKYLDQARQQGSIGPLHWQDDFVVLVRSTGLISTAQLERLAKAYYGPAPTVQAHTDRRPGEAVEFRLAWGNNWDLPDMKFAKAVRAVRLGDRELAVRDENPDRTEQDLLSRDVDWDIEGEVLLGDLPPGEYELEFIVDAGVVDEQTQWVGIDGRPGQKERWPSPIVSWQGVVTHRVTVHDDAAEIVKLVTDPSLDPVKAGAIVPPLLAVVPRSNGQQRLDIDWPKPPGEAPVPMSFQVVMRAGDQEVSLGSRSGKTSLGRGVTNMRLRQPLPPDVRTVDLVLTPDARNAERYFDVKEIWGETVVLKDVPITRGDLPAESP